MLRCATAAFLAFAMPAVAADRCEGGARADWQSPEAARAVLASEGYRPVTDMYIEDGCYELVTSRADGIVIEVLLDPVTLEIVLTEDPE